MKSSKWIFFFIMISSLLFLSGLFLTGCSTRMIDFTVISTKNIDWAKADSFKRGTSRVDGEDLIHLIIFIPTGVPNLKEAVDKAIESVPGAVALLDGVVTYKFWWIPYIYGQQSYIVEGTPLIDQKSFGALKSPYIVTYIDDEGKVKKTEPLTRSEYDELKKTISEKS